MYEATRLRICGFVMTAHGEALAHFTVHRVSEFTDMLVHASAPAWLFATYLRHMKAMPFFDDRTFDYSARAACDMAERHISSITTRAARMEK